MKEQFTKKFLLENNAVAIRYSTKNQDLIRKNNIDTIGYVTSKLYGWRCDVYLIQGVYVTIGYNSVGRVIDDEEFRVLVEM